MRTTLNVDDELMRRVREVAASTGRTITQVVEDALRQALAGRPHESEDFRLEWVSAPGKLQPGVDLADRDSLYDRMEDRT